MTIRLERDGGVATITLDRPPLNVLTQAMIEELRAALAGLAADESLRALVLAAGGKHFSAGADVGEHMPPTYREMIPAFVSTLDALAAFPVPIVAAVRGRCLGGGFELVQCADVVVAGEGATFGQPEIALAVTAPVACVLLPRLAASGLARELLFSGDTISALRAREAGLVQHVVHDDSVEAEALALARRFARHSAAALRATKRTLLRACEGSRREGLREAARIYVDELMATEDAVEGLVAFTEKRAPAWRDR